MTAVRLVDGWIISDYIAVCERWNEYFEQLYQIGPSAVSLEASGVAIPDLVS